VVANDPSASACIDSAVVVHYFHRTLRCQTCLTIEAYTREALESSFQSALADGRLVWRPLNLEAPGNAHCEEDFALQFNSVIVTAPAAADSVRWWNLDGVWDLVGDKATFLEYIRLNVGGVLQRGAPPALPKPE
jgi:hypothetical protein